MGSRHHLIGKARINAQITNTPRADFGGGASGTVILGRMGYDVTLSANATYL